jgi:hypothetical protein
VYQVLKMGVSLIGHKTHLELVGWHNEEKMVFLGTPEQAVLPALILTVLLVVPVAALTYRWIEKPAMDFARGGKPVAPQMSWLIWAALQRRHLGRWLKSTTAPTAPRAAPSRDLDGAQGWDKVQDRVQG